LKFTDRGFVALAILLIREKGYLEFKVEDSGMGISENYLKVIFDRFRKDRRRCNLDLIRFGLSITSVCHVGERDRSLPLIGICFLHSPFHIKVNQTVAKNFGIIYR
jgi:light-regulated signal transduction histidine kinase (bacteriophytochrome)